MHFCHLRKLHPEPELFLNGTLIPVVEEVKFLGLIFDRKLSFLPHLRYLKNKCMKALNLIRVFPTHPGELINTLFYICTNPWSDLN